MDAKNLKVLAAAFIILVGTVGVGLYVRSDGGTLAPVEEGYGATPGTEFYEKMTFLQEPRLAPVVVATTTNGASKTLVANDLLSVDYHIVTPGGLASAADLTYTFPATSTLKNFLPRIGMRERHCFFMTATTTDSNIIFAEGTGIQFVTASTTAASDSPSLAIGSQQRGCFEMERLPDGGNGIGNIQAVLNIFHDAN